MGKRHQAIGIKQVIRYEWMQKAADLLLAGLGTQAIRQELHDYLTDRKGSGSRGDRSEQTRRWVVANLMNIWVSPAPELVAFRDSALAFLRTHPSVGLAVHWGMIAAVYPFWFNVARQTGRLLTLQDQVTQAQIVHRLKEQYGDRSTVSRYARYVIRSFVAWGVLKDAEAKGCYEKLVPMNLADHSLVMLMFEAVLHTTPEGQGVLSLLLNHPAFFPFHLSVMTGASIAQHSDRIEVVRYGLDDEMLKMRTALRHG